MAVVLKPTVPDGELGIVTSPEAYAAAGLILFGGSLGANAQTGETSNPVFDLTASKATSGTIGSLDEDGPRICGRPRPLLPRL